MGMKLITHLHLVRDVPSAHGVSSIFVAEGHAHYSELVRGLHVVK